MLARSLARSLARLLACLLACIACFALLCVLLCLLCFALRVERQKLKRRRLVEFLVFNLLALAWLELARLVLGLLGMVACFAWFGCLFCFGLLGFVACFALV